MLGQRVHEYRNAEWMVKNKIVLLVPGVRVAKLRRVQEVMMVVLRNGSVSAARTSGCGSSRCDH